MIIHLGVTDLPYIKARSRRAKPKIDTQTTGDVAEHLERRYHVFQHFLELHGDAVTGAVENGLQGALESMLMGAPRPPSLLSSGAGAIEEAFRRMIDSKELDRLGYPGIPTRASIIGVRSRFKRRRDPGRPSFQDTSLYEGSFKVWAD